MANVQTPNVNVAVPRREKCDPLITVGVVAALGIWAMTRPCKKETQK